MKQISLKVGPLKTNCFIVAGAHGGAVVIDPGDDAEMILETIQKEGLTVGTIMLTHGHWDHIQALGALKAETGAQIIIHEADAPMLLQPRRLTSGVVLQSKTEPVQADILAKDGDTFEVDGLSFTYMNTPGHTPGSSTILCGGALFTGDTLFEGDCGRCDLEGGDFRQMLSSLRRLYELEGDFDVFPGHEGFSRLSRERERNPYMLQAIGK